MKKYFILCLITLCLSFAAISQITKYNWMMGGDGRLAISKEKLYALDSKATDIRLSPTIGYFFRDQFAGGARISLRYYRLNSNFLVTKDTKLDIGPFLRYYFLDVDNRVNLFGQSAYQYSDVLGHDEGDTHGNHTFTFTAGPVIYFNSSVGLEITGNYEIVNAKPARQKTLYLGFGLQIHLERDSDHY